MTARHHPDEILLGAYAAGTLDFGQHAAIATHLLTCPECRGWVRSMECVGGSMLEALPPASLPTDALAATQARLADAPLAHPAPPSGATDVAGLPAYLRSYRMGRWQWVAPRVHVRRIEAPQHSPTRVFLLRSGAGTQMLQHSHTGIEMTCVLKGAFRHDGGHFKPGDFDYGDDTVDHRPMVDDGEACVCLVAMQGQLQLNGLIGRIIQPLVRL